ncbi:hypothetical protein CGLO_11462 [Colletotrichum gloeosporioides Cg-14]|uniref:Uncharacterized protein n=1 Tax=Colletotrichum gloeosporioides (strain Cg-14) TaxID=1237896 RepID=T0K0Q3_COLGC|nr:hypothetical protein CGLO_11462 [Colletotrichum gloeosporioides Cg-14]
MANGDTLMRSSGSGHGVALQSFGIQGDCDSPRIQRGQASPPINGSGAKTIHHQQNVCVNPAAAPSRAMLLGPTAPYSHHLAAVMNDNMSSAWEPVTMPAFGTRNIRSRA